MHRFTVLLWAVAAIGIGACQSAPPPSAGAPAPISKAPMSTKDVAQPGRSAPRAADASCSAGTCDMPDPDTYSVGWLPWLADLKSWRNYDPSTIAGAGRLVASSDGQPTGESYAGDTCEVLDAGTYIYVMKWQNNEVADDYIENTEVIYLKTGQRVGPDYIRHSQLAAGFPVFCAGEFTIAPGHVYGWSLTVNELTQINNFSGHYKPKCKCLGVLSAKLDALGVKMDWVVTQFMGSAQDC